jgi:hypothetical protein
VNRELPLLAAIGGFFRWCEELLAILSGPLLTAGLLIALVDLLTDGKLLATQPELLYGWAIAMGAGLDAQLIGASVKLGRAVRTGAVWAAIGYTVLVLALAYVGFVAAQVFATQQADGITTAQALARLGMDGTTWLVQRSVLSVALVVLSGILRYVPPSAERSAEDEQAHLERELQLAPLRAQLRARKALGWRDVGRAIAQGAPSDRESFPIREPFPIGPSAPTTTLGVTPLPPAPPEGPDDSPTSPPRRGRSQHATRRRGSQRVLRLPRPRPEQRVRAVLATAPAASVRDIAAAAGVSFSTAAKYRRLWLAEHQQHSDAQAAE